MLIDVYIYIYMCVCVHTHYICIHAHMCVCTCIDMRFQICRILEIRCSFWRLNCLSGDPSGDTITVLKTQLLLSE